MTFSEQIAAEVGSWPGVVVDDGELGELAFTVGSRELGHLHGDHAAHFGFPKSLWQPAPRRRAASRATRCSRAASVPRRDEWRQTTTCAT